MAGLIGLYAKNKTSMTEELSNTFDMMLDALYYDKGKQKSNVFKSYPLCAGLVYPLSNNQIESHVFSDTEIGYTVMVEGIVHVSEDEMKLIRNHYNLSKELNYFQSVLYLFDYYGDLFVDHISGWFNILFYDLSDERILLFNDKLGYLPLYVFETEDFFLFSSKIDSIINSSFLKEIKVDWVSFAEQLLFNHIVSDNTLIEGVSTIENATKVEVFRNEVKRTKYWRASEIFSCKHVSRKDSLDLLNQALKKSFDKFIELSDQTIGVSLTGGWDSRVVLSYLINTHRKQLKTYSFGTSESDDTTIPELISSELGFDYFPYFLEKEYLEKDFLVTAEETINLSSGNRTFKRAHYLFALKQFSSYTDIVGHGIFGDEVFKTELSKGNEVLSSNTVALLGKGLTAEAVLALCMENKVLEQIMSIYPSLAECLHQRLHHVMSRFDDNSTYSEKYMSFRIENNLRKYFGNEVNSYNDFAYSFSPFIDSDFLQEYARNYYIPTNKALTKNGLVRKIYSTLLYIGLVKKNASLLMKFQTSRGFSMQDVYSINGLVKIFKRKVLRIKKKNVNDFNSDITDSLFYDRVLGMKNYLPFTMSDIDSLTRKDEAISFYFWINNILKTR